MSFAATMSKETGPCHTSPLELIRVVWKRSPLPHEFWVFHTRSEGGLWVPPAPAAQICQSRHTESVNSIYSTRVVYGQSMPDSSHKLYGQFVVKHFIPKSMGTAAVAIAIPSFFLGRLDFGAWLWGISPFSHKSISEFRHWCWEWLTHN